MTGFRARVVLNWMTEERLRGWAVVVETRRTVFDGGVGGLAELVGVHGCLLVSIAALSRCQNEGAVVGRSREMEGRGVDVEVQWEHH